VKPESFGESHLSPIGEYIYPRYKNYIVNLSFELNIDNINQLLTIINEKLEILTNTDGGHISRSPVKQLNLLRHLIEIRSIIAILKNVDADGLHQKTIKMGEFCRSFQMPDGYFSGTRSVPNFLRSLGSGL